MRRHHVHALATSTDSAMAAAARAISRGSSMWSAPRGLQEARKWYLNRRPLGPMRRAWVARQESSAAPCGYSGPAWGGTGGAGSRMPVVSLASKVPPARFCCVCVVAQGVPTRQNLSSITVREVGSCYGHLTRVLGAFRCGISGAMLPRPSWSPF